MTLDELLGRVVVDKEDGCWVWVGDRTQEGYGLVRVPRSSLRRRKGVHRVVYEQLVGPIPPGLHLDHLCRNTSCVNPDHLEPVTVAENVLRGVGITAQNAQRTHCRRGHKFTAQNTYRHGGKRHCRICRMQRQRDARSLEKAA